jgi:Tfp pilus assembly protein PilX
MSDLIPQKGAGPMRNPSGEQGFALVAAIVLLTVIMGLGLGLLLFTDNQQKASAREQSSEAAFNVAEAALNAQVGQISRAWPTTAEAFPEKRCTSGETYNAKTGCPTPIDLKSDPNSSSTTCSGNDIWGSPLSNQWTTYVREDVGGSPYFNSMEETTASVFDKGRLGKLWVRTVGVVQCHPVAIVTLVSRQEVATSFPEAAAVANWFETSNNGNKTIVNTQGPNAPKSGNVSMRCTGFKNAEECEKWEKGKEQVSPDTTGAGASPSPTLSASQLEEEKQQAEFAGTYYAAGNCPGSLEAITGLPTYVEGPCELSYNGGTGNSYEKPGFLILEKGTIKLNSNGQFFGVIYAVNKQESSGVVVEIHGCNKLTGAILVDGNGGISFGSCKENFVYDPRAFKEVKGYAGATPTRNGFRVLPTGQ